MYTIHKITETFWSRDATDLWVLAHFELKLIKILELIKSLMLNCFN